MLSGIDKAGGQQLLYEHVEALPGATTEMKASRTIPFPGSSGNARHVSDVCAIVLSNSLHLPSPYGMLFDMATLNVDLIQLQAFFS